MPITWHDHLSSQVIVCARYVFRLGLMLLVLGVLIAAIVGGLQRAGILPASLADLTWVGHAAVDHAALMFSAFLGSVIGTERAVALRQPVAFSGPLASALSGLAILTGHPTIAGGLGFVASAVFVGMNLMFQLRQSAPHIAMLLIGAMAWACGNAIFAFDQSASRALPWWFAFLVLTIAAERLEMHRLMPVKRMAHPLLFGIIICLLMGAAISLFSYTSGGLIFGVALVALAAWLMAFDVARRTIHTVGLSRYMAACLLGGYFWLVIAGLAWVGNAEGYPCKDMALHALGLGFVMSMVMGHALVILTAVVRVKLRYGPWFYLPVILLNASLAVRLFLPFVWPATRNIGVALNVTALASFALILLISALHSTTNDSTALLPHRRISR